jgi:hypothetical protein
MADMILTNIEMCHHCPKRRMVELNGRTVTCHSVCPEYKEARAKRDEELQANYEQQQLIAGYFVDKVKERMT